MEVWLGTTIFVYTRTHAHTHTHPHATTHAPQALTHTLTIHTQEGVGADATVQVGESNSPSLQEMMMKVMAQQMAQQSLQHDALLSVLNQVQTSLAAVKKASPSAGSKRRASSYKSTCISLIVPAVDSKLDPRGMIELKERNSRKNARMQVSYYV
jgi:hypothetical protein